MLNFLFWNVRKESKSRKTHTRSIQRQVRFTRIAEAIAQFAHLHDADILIFAELEVPAAEILAALASATTHDYYEVEPDQCTKIRIFTRFSEHYSLSIPGAGDARYTVRQINCRRA
jgi:hypothetical protein